MLRPVYSLIHFITCVFVSQKWCTYALGQLPLVASTLGLIQLMAVGLVHVCTMIETKAYDQEYRLGIWQWCVQQSIPAHI